MKFFKREMWAYAVLLIILFAIAAIAVATALSYIEDHIPAEQYQIVSMIMTSITLGFMLIAGSFGLWAIQFSAEAESRRRVGRMVDGMDYLSDGLLSVDETGRITGSNPSARRIARGELANEQSIGDAFPVLEKKDLELLLNQSETNEIERTVIQEGQARVLRFRSQPSEGLMLIQISDVTTMNHQKVRSRQIARLQLVGELSRGVAHDFNNILCGVSGYASLISRMGSSAPEVVKAVHAIERSVEKGISLAGHLIQLAQPAIGAHYTTRVREHVETAAETLKTSLPEGWTVACSDQDRLPVVALTGSQIEQMVVNLGFLAADSVDAPAVLSIASGIVSRGGLFDVGEGYAGALVITPGNLPRDAAGITEVAARDQSEAGVILSVVRSMLTEAGGALDTLRAPGHGMIFRVRLPLGNSIGTSESESSEVPEEIKSYLSHWKILMGRNSRDLQDTERLLREWKVDLTLCTDMGELFSGIESNTELDGIILDVKLLGRDTAGLLRAVLKLRPFAGVVAVCDEPESMPSELAADIVFLPHGAIPSRMLTALIEAKTVAVRRQR